MVVFNQVVFHALGHAAQHAQNHLSALLLLGVQRVKSVVNLVLRILSHAASVHKYGVGIGFVLAHFVASHLHHRSHHLAIGHVHLAAVGLNI